MKLRKGKTKSIVESSVDAALLAVEVYNKPRTNFRSQAYIAMMVIAWTRLFHAHFRSKIGETYYYKKENGRYEIVDGEKKAWELSTCIKKYGKLKEPVRQNLEFFVGLRNKIEHRAVPKSEVDNLIFGECQALLYNYETLLVQWFGSEYALHENLVYSLQFSHMRTQEQKRSQRRAIAKEMKAIFDYVERYRAGLPDDVFGSQEYSIKLIQIPKISNTNRSDLAIEFVRWDELSEEDRQKYDRLHTIIKEKPIEKKEPKIVKLISKDDERAKTTLKGDIQTVRISRDPSETKGILLYEELSEDLLEEVDNIVDLNDLVADGSGRFLFSEEVYYQIYYKREKVTSSEEKIELLASTGFQFYAPVLYWLLRLPVRRSGELIRQVANNPKHPSIFNVMKLSVLLGSQAEKWLEATLSKTWPSKEIAPEKYSAFDNMRSLAETRPRRLAALRIDGERQLASLDEKLQGTPNILLNNSEMASGLLSKYCMYVSQGEKEKKTVCRFLDIMAYGERIENEGYKYVNVLTGNR